MSTVVGLPKEVKGSEHRVAMQTDKVTELVRYGHEVVAQAGAGEGASFADAEYAEAGVCVVV